MNIRHLSFRLLQVYQAVLQHGSISQAARQLHLTQPTVSIQLKKLTEWAGEPLLEQEHGLLVPTPVGAELYRASQDVLGRFADFSQFVQSARAGNSGSLSLGIVTTAKYILPPLLAEFSRQFPQIELTLNIGNRAQIVSRFEQQQDDLFLFSHPPAGNQVLARRLLKNPLQLIAPPGHWAAGRADLTMADLKAERFLIREPGSATRLMLETWLSGQGLALEKTMQIESNEAIRLSVASGLGLAVLSAHTLKAGTEPVQILSVKGLPLESHWYLVARRDRRLSATATQLTRYLPQGLRDYLDPAWLVNDLDSLTQAFMAGPQNQQPF
ncbi:LysR family transcriptional regulator [Rheinheimera texasensis]|jgi:DNA-binding transcriptional LysR family regulator|uniref:LysR family transcriptional regulator n=1 Tax=Rheinheimera texasensis TaxID=306205 RepID=UPI0004E0D325|nr:LysR family transcriptional regulator [Rheinheimera texasensis]